MIRAALALAAIVAFRGAFAAEGGLELLVARYADAAAAEQDVSRAAALASKYAFEITGAGSIRLAVFTANPAAERCYRSVGFREVSVAENAFSFGDESWGRRSMVLTRE